MARIIEAGRVASLLLDHKVLHVDGRLTVYCRLFGNAAEELGDALLLSRVRWRRYPPFGDEEDRTRCRLAAIDEANVGIERIPGTSTARSW